MGVKTKEEILNQLNAIVGENDSDDYLNLLTDINDTYADFESKSNDTTNWKQKYEDNDKEWRKKYRDAFFNGVKDEDGKDPSAKSGSKEDQEPAPEGYDDLLKPESK